MRLVAATASLAVLSVAVAAPSVAQEAYDAVDVDLTRVVGVIEIRTGGVDRVTVDYDPGEGLIDAPSFEVEGDELRIAQLPRRTRISCRSRGGDPRIEVNRGGRHPIEDFGHFLIRAPEGARVSVRGGAVTGSIDDVGSLDLGLASCGSVTVGDVAEQADITVSGSGGVKAGAIGGELDVAVNGSGDVEVGSVAQGVDAAVAGSGDVTVASVDGSIDASIAGSGDITIRGGRATSIDASIAGSGDLRFDGVAEDVSLSSIGSGDIYVTEVTGRVRSSSVGSGSVHVARD